MAGDEVSGRSMQVMVNLSLDARRLPATIDAELHEAVSSACGVTVDEVLSYRILRRSIDARQKPRVKLLYQIMAELREGTRPRGGLAAPPVAADEPWRPPTGHCGLREPVVVGAGPAGLFAALVLARAGCRPLVLERGRDVERRRLDIERFLAERQVNPESNYLYGEGGAGTWSDGKLFTRVRDPRSLYVLESFVAAGADPAILYYSHPHVGSDRLPGIIARLRQEICALGGRFEWDCRVVDVAADASGRAFSHVLLADGSRLAAPAALIACGHSARDFILTLSKRVSTSLKGFQIGCRIEHEQSFINELRYGRPESLPALGPAEYLYSSRPPAPALGATTFCMCPGGMIIPAVCEHEHLSTNGMSNAARDGHYANSAIVSSIADDAFSTAAAAFAFLDELERRAFVSGGGNYDCPAQRAEDFLARRRSGCLPAGSSYQLGLRPERLDSLLPPRTYDALALALRHFARQARGFATRGLLVGLETQVSSPLRFTRRPDSLASSMDRLYIGGEGGGMAGGIMSAAIDGIKLAEAMIRSNQ